MRLFGVKKLLNEEAGFGQSLDNFAVLSHTFADLMLSWRSGEKQERDKSLHTLFITINQWVVLALH